jgi:hypothetical protein
MSLTHCVAQSRAPCVERRGLVKAQINRCPDQLIDRTGRGPTPGSSRSRSYAVRLLAAVAAPGDSLGLSVERVTGGDAGLAATSRVGSLADRASCVRDWHSTSVEQAGPQTSLPQLHEADSTDRTLDQTGCRFRRASSPARSISSFARTAATTSSSGTKLASASLRPFISA